MAVSAVRLPVLYEDNHLIVVHKPAGVPSQGDVTGDASVVDLVSADLKERYRKPGNVYLGLVHRLDRPVAGVLLLAKTSKAAARLSAQLRERKIEKTYRALVEGAPPHPSGTLTHHLAEGEQHGSRAFDAPGPDRKPATLRYRVQETTGRGTLLEVKPETGRKHQIRVQLAHVGCPIVGDGRYGARTPYRPGNIALVARELRLVHPVTGAPLHLTLPPGACPLDAFLRRT